jgi:UDP-glucose:(heptosyl)LPS alpha-1,3-glucosyltransferase
MMSESFSAQALLPMTIGILRRGYSSSGGVEVYLKGLARGLVAEGHRVILIGTHAWPVAEWPGGEILRCRGKTPSEYAREVSSILGGKSPLFDLTLSVEKVPGCDLYRTDEGVHAAWLEVRAPFLDPLARLFQNVSPKHREKLRLERKLFSPEGAGRVISLSLAITREIARRYHYPEGRIRMIRNGVSLRRKDRSAEREGAKERLGINRGEKVILFVGTGWERKGLRFATKAVEALGDPSIRLVVAGEGNVRKYRSPVIRFLGPVREMDEVYETADLLLFPTIYDPFPLSTLEALAMGVPVITSAANGVSEVLATGVHGEVIDDPSDIEALSGALRKWIDLMGDPREAERIRAACETLASEFTLERNLRETLAVIREVVEEKKGRGS